MPRLKQADRTQRTRAKLKKSASSAFALKGVHTAAIEDIARAAGYSRGAFYGNYQDKLSLLIDLLGEKHVTEVQLWRDVMETAGDPDLGLAALTRRFEDCPDMLEGSLLSAELQLEADRNPDFRPVYMDYLDRLHAEIRSLFITTLARNNKSPPPNLDAIVVTTRLLTLGLGTKTVLGNEIGSRTTPSEIVLQFLNDVIEAAPPRTR